MIDITVIIILSYLIGSIPTSIIFSRLLKGIDIRDFGSKNAGATNVYRVMGAKVAITVLLIDALKGFVAVFFIAKLKIFSVDSMVPTVYLQIITGLCAILGHIWTIFAQFKGGKGVGTALGVFIGLLPVPALVALAAWIVVVSVTRYVSMASLAAAAILPIAAFFKKDEPALFVFAIIIGALIWFTHIPNIKRLWAGTENKFGKKNNQ
jgi:acyl phosphate:glycerol-3-phosphate acyltransferase